MNPVKSNCSQTAWMHDEGLERAKIKKFKIQLVAHTIAKWQPFSFYVCDWQELLFPRIAIQIMKEESQE